MSSGCGLPRRERGGYNSRNADFEQSFVLIVSWCFSADKDESFDASIMKIDWTGEIRGRTLSSTRRIHRVGNLEIRAAGIISG